MRWNEIDIKPGDSIPYKMSKIREYTKINILPGLHLVSEIGEDNSMISIQKSNVIVDLMGTLKWDDDVIGVNTAGELVTNQGDPIPTFEYRGTYSGSTSVDFWIRIDGATTFEWTKESTLPGAPASPYANNGITITGDWQALSDGIEIRITQTSGHTTGDRMIIAFGQEENYGIRVGRKFQANYVENVSIIGNGIIDGNVTNNAKPTYHHHDQPSAVKFQGRLRNCHVRDITMTDYHRSYCGYGDHSGTFGDGGSVSGGESFDMYNISVIGTKTINNQSNYLAGLEFGHPQHRGSQFNVRIFDNYVDSYATPIELNFKLTNYQCINNYVKVGADTQGVFCWRKSENGVIIGNALFETTAGVKAFNVNAPPGWEKADNLYVRDNVNLNDDLDLISPENPY